MDVVGSGFGRTGTLSTKAALEQLGFGPCHHMEELFRRPSQGRQWSRIARREPVDWTDVFADYRSSVDFPSSVRWKEILAAFPDAKVLHTVRDPERWYDSTASTIARTPEFVPGWLRLFPLIGRPNSVAESMVWEELFGGRFWDRDHAIDVFERWTADVVASVPEDKLLVFEVADGWEPLCAFLGVPVPDRPFPRVNDREAMLRRLHALRWAGRVLPAAAAVTALATARAVSGSRRSSPG